MSFPPLFTVFALCWLHFSCQNSGQLRDRLLSLDSVTEIITSRSYYFKFKVIKVDKEVGKNGLIKWSIQSPLVTVSHLPLQDEPDPVVLWQMPLFSLRTSEWLKSRSDCWSPHCCHSSLISCYLWYCCSFVLAPPWFWIWSHYNLTLQHSNFNTATLQNKQTYRRDCFQRMVFIFTALRDLLGQKENSSSVKVDT